MRENSYRKVQLTGEGVEAELIQSRDMMCGHLHMEYCGSGGCRSHIVFDGLVYDMTGQLFLLVPEPSYEGASTGATLSDVNLFMGTDNLPSWIELVDGSFFDEDQPPVKAWKMKNSGVYDLINFEADLSLPRKG